MNGSTLPRGNPLSSTTRFASVVNKAALSPSTMAWVVTAAAACSSSQFQTTVGLAERNSPQPVHRPSDDLRPSLARLLTVLTEIDAEQPTAAPGLLAPPALTSGDEVQALFAEPDRVVAVMQRLSDALHPVQWRFGLGLGVLTTELPGRADRIRVPLLDGPCFHNARAALAVAADRGAWAAVAGFVRFDEPLNAILELLGTLRQGWTERQGVYSAASRDRTQKEVAQHQQVSPSVVSESLKAAHFETVRRGEAGVAAMLRLAVEAWDEAPPGQKPAGKQTSARGRKR